MCISDKRDFVFEIINTDQSVEVLSNEDECLINIENDVEKVNDVENTTTLQGIYYFYYIYTY